MSIRTRSTPDMISLMTFWRGVELGWSSQALQVGQQLAVDELQHLALGEHFFPALAVRRGPVLPAVGLLERRRKVGPDRFGVLGFVRFAFVQNAQEQNPGQFGNVLHRPRAVRAAHDVADRLHGPVDRLLRVQPLAVAVSVGRSVLLCCFLLRHWVIRSKSSLECCSQHCRRHSARSSDKLLLKCSPYRFRRCQLPCHLCQQSVVVLRSADGKSACREIVSA